MIESANKSTLVDLLGMRARERGAAPAILAPGRVPLTYQALFAHIEQACLSLGAMGIRRTSRVAISLAHGPELGVAMLAVMTTATAAPLDPETDEGSFREF